MKNLINRFVREEEGQDIIEYALLAAFVSIIAATVIQTIGSDVKTIYDNVKIQTTNAASASGGGPRGACVRIWELDRRSQRYRRGACQTANASARALTA